MKNVSLIALMIVFTLSACKKEGADNWVGTYNGQAGQTIQRVVISKRDDSSIKIELQTPFNSTFVTYATIQNSKLSGDAATINEIGTIASFSGTYTFTGSATRSGNNITIGGSAVSTTNASDIKPYYFEGSK